MSTHRTLDGDWAVCDEAESCPLLFHVDCSPAEARLMPERVFEELANIIQPPDVVNDTGRYWQDDAGRHHREYDLPAAIQHNGLRGWFRYGDAHRIGKAAIIGPGRADWWQNGSYLPEGQPA